MDGHRVIEASLIMRNTLIQNIIGQMFLVFSVSKKIVRKHPH